MTSIEGTPYEVEDTLLKRVLEIAKKVSSLRSQGAISAEMLGRLRRFFRIKNIYHSNAIEGNQLKVRETRLVVEQGLTLTGKSLKDQAEAKNLSAAINFLEQLADADTPFTEADIRQMHHLILKDINDADAGRYRTVPVEISGSDYKPSEPESIPAEMRDFCSWLSGASVPGGKWRREDAILVAAAAHTWFVMIHPFIDGNGRVARLLLNLILMRYGYPIAIITKEDRGRYYDSLEEAQASDLTALVSLVVECVEESLEEYEAARLEQREHEEWAESIVNRFQKKERIRATNQYEVWRNAMDLLKSVFMQTSELLGKRPLAAVWFKDFGYLGLEKYFALQSGISAKKTWFFRMDFRSGERSARYLFFFGSPGHSLKDRQVEVSLHIAREEPAGSFNYERLEFLDAQNVPSLIEVGYDSSHEKFISRKRPDFVNRSSKIEDICRAFFDDVVQKHFGGQ